MLRISDFRRLLASLLGSLLLIVAGLLAWHFWPVSIPPPNAAPAVIVSFVATDHFVDLPIDQQQAYVDRLEHLSLLELIKAANDAAMTDTQRRAGLQNAINARREKVMNDYFKIPPGKQRTAYLDKTIDEIEKSPIKLPFSGGRGPKLTAEQQKHRSDTISPIRQAEMAQFYADMLGRRAQRELR